MESFFYRQKPAISYQPGIMIWFDVLVCSWPQFQINSEVYNVTPSLTHSLTHSVTYSLQHVLATPQVAWLTHLELTRIMFSKRICYDLFNRRQKCRKMECLESHVYFSKYVAAPASVTKELGPVLVYKVLDPASIFPRWKIISINYRTNIFNCIQ